MTGHATRIDETSVHVLLAFPVTDVTGVPGWAAVLRDAGTGVDSWDEFRDRLTTVAADAGWPESAVTAFAQVAEDGGGVAVVAGLVELEYELPDLYAALTEGPFGWVPEDYQTYLTDLWGAGWTDRLSEQLDARWGMGWQQHPGDHKAFWLADLVVAGGLVDQEPTAEPEVAAEPVMTTDEAVAEVVAMAMALPGFAELTDEEAADAIAEAIEKART